MFIGIGVVVVILLIAVIALLMACFARDTTPAPAAVTNLPSGRVLTVVYSESKTKSTLTVAKWIQGYVGGDLEEIHPVTPYPESYAKVILVAKKELDSQSWPEIQPLPFDVTGYDVIFVGTPVWFGTAAPPLRRFLADAKLSGKTVVPFCTHGGGGAGRAFAAVKTACPEATVLPGLALRGPNIVQRKLGHGSEVLSSAAHVAEWLESLKWNE
ncbi:MAG: NAD(P)H-dependent oxidoreductase [Victivallales bacterium]|nr:NAD(P)H-dependent oxidoreductase [Victivallales bacterium]